MKYEFATRFDDITPSMIRSMLVECQGDDMINFSPGFPDHNAFPIEAIQRLSHEVLLENPDLLLQYARAPIFPELKVQLKKFFNREYINCLDTDDITVTSGSNEGLEMAAKVFLNPGDYMVCEDPTFIGALNGFRSNGAKIIGVGMDDEGIILEELEAAFRHHPKPKMLYTIPNFQNPTTKTATLERRKAVYDLCLKYQVMILEDDPYGTLRFKGEAVPTLKSMDTNGIVVYFASLSKIMSPGMRLAAIIANQEIITKFNVIKGASAGAATNWSQLVIARFLEKEDVEKHLAHLKNVYKSKSTLMYEMMKKSFHPDVKIIAPDGGMFIWFILPDFVDEEAFLKMAIQAHIAIVPQKAFAIDMTKPLKGFRLSFTSASKEEIERGISKLGKFTYLVMK